MIERTTRLIEVGSYAARVEIDLEYDDTGWSPYVSHADALKIERVRRALKAGDIATAKTEAEVFELTPA